MRVAPMPHKKRSDTALAEHLCHANYSGTLVYPENFSEVCYATHPDLIAVSRRVPDIAWTCSVFLTCSVDCPCF